MSEWQEVKLGEVIKVIGGGTPKTSITEYWGGDIPWLAPPDFVATNRWVEKTTKSITQLGLNHSSAKLLGQGDVIISARGTVGALAQLKKPMAFSQSSYGLRARNNFIEANFLFYIMKNCIRNIKQFAYGTVFDTITTKIFDEVQINLPPLPEQKAIASVLSSLDDKIDLLHRQNKTLEDMAQTLFRQWFVEEAQEGWEGVELGSFFEICSGKGLKKEHLSDTGSYPVLGANGEIGRTNDHLFNEKLLFTGRVGTLGNIFRVNNEKVWLSDNTLIFKSIKYFYFVYFALKLAKLANYNVGSTQPLIRQSDIKMIEIMIPNNQLRLKEFENEAELIFAKLDSNIKQIQTLEKLRDTLLPKLMSGEVRVALNGGHHDAN